LPQPNQQLWVTLVTWSPILPVVAAIAAAAIVFIVQRDRILAVLAAAHSLLWPSMGLIFLWLPKPS